MGDAAHSMVNHMAQGAATAMEDGAFLGRVLREVVSGRLTLPEVISIYEKSRMPKAHFQAANLVLEWPYLALTRGSSG